MHHLSSQFQWDLKSTLPVTYLQQAMILFAQLLWDFIPSKQRNPGWNMSHSPGLKPQQGVKEPHDLDGSAVNWQ